MIKIIEKRFKKAFDKSGYELVIKHGADAEILHHYLTSPKTLALFWVSHAVSDKNLEGMGKTTQVILDEKNNVNLAPIFKNIHQNLIYLSIIGCEAQYIIDKFKSQGQYENNPKLVTHSFKNKISLYKGIKQSLKRARELIGKKVKDSLPRANGSVIRSRHKNKYIKIIAKKELVEIKDLGVMLPKGGLEIEIIPSPEQKVSVQLSVGKLFVGLLLPNTSAQRFIIPKMAIKKRIKLVASTKKAMATIGDKSIIGLIKIRGINRSFDIDFYKNLEGNIEGIDTNIYYLRPIEI